jgi:hypothetical protein
MTLVNMSLAPILSVNLTTTLFDLGSSDIETTWPEKLSPEVIGIFTD